MTQESDSLGRKIGENNGHLIWESEDSGEVINGPTGVPSNWEKARSQKLLEEEERSFEADEKRRLAELDQGIKFTPVLSSRSERILSALVSSKSRVRKSAGQLQMNFLTAVEGGIVHLEDKITQFAGAISMRETRRRTA